MFLSVIILCNLLNLISANLLSYDEARNAVIDAEEMLSTGGRLYLSPRERQANKILMSYKTSELLDGFNNQETLLSGMHFFKAKESIEKSKIYKVLRKMPKGGLLHGHNIALVSSEWVIKNLTYYPNVLKCINKNDLIILSFRKSETHDCSTYVKVSDERDRSENAEFYDKQLEKAINLYSPRPEVEYPTITDVWTKFQNMFITIGDFLSFMPAFRAYHWQLMEEMYEDGVIYIELRLSFGQCYDDTGKVYSSFEVVRELIDLVKEFKIVHPGFLGVKAIYTTQRKIDITMAKKKLQFFRELYYRYPGFIIGFDLVGQEDLGNPLYHFTTILHNIAPGAKFFFHAGETNWYGGSSDYNILDAILLNTTRIGHGYALLKHPVLWNAVKRRDIAIEVNPISNQVLNLVHDLRNHPASFYISEDIPIVISNDDPGFWNAKGLSYDFYYALMSFGSNRAGLRLLKKLVLNSIKYTGLTQEEKYTAHLLLQKQWEKFIDFVLSNKIK